MITLHKQPDFSTVRALKEQYLKSLSAPLDGMWEAGFINPLAHWEIRDHRQLAGFFVANDEGALLQFYLQPAYAARASRIFQQVVVQSNLSRAMVGTIDPLFLSHSLDIQRGVSVHTYLYEVDETVEVDASSTKAPPMRRAQANEVDRILDFQRQCLVIPDNAGDWLRGYSARLIERRELYVFGDNDSWLGLGELRRSESQPSVADLGMMVAPAHRGNGWAAHILARLKNLCAADALRAICSTTVENVPAQKAIARAGFVSRHRILTVTF